MKKLILHFFALALIISFTQSCNEALVEEPESLDLELKSASSAKKSYIVLLNDADLNNELSKLKGYEKKQTAVKSASAKILKRAGVIDAEVEHVYGTALKGFSVKIPPGQFKKLENDPSVINIIEDKFITLVEPKAKPGSEDVVATAAQVVPWGITRVNGGADGTGKTAWIIDTGIDLDHPDLLVNASKGATFVTRTKSADDDNGHGTHVAGTIAALNNDIGVIGVAAGATVVPVKVLDRRGSGYYSWIIAGVDFVAAYAQPGDVANMSLGGGVYLPVDEAVFNASQNGILFALAAGNESDDANNHSPARVNGNNIFTISAMDINDDFAYFSNYGTPVDYCEPGVSIYSTVKGGSYATYSGTSMAAPHMAGILLLGNYKNDGEVNGDPDGNPDPIAVVNGTIDPPVDNPPNADFTFETSNLTVTFTDASTDDGAITAWSWNFGDGNTSSDQSPVHTYASDGNYTVSLTVTDDNNSTNSTTKSVNVSQVTGGEILLSAVITGNKVKKATLTWSGATSANVNIYRNGSLITATANDGSFSDNLGKITSGTFIYQIIDENNIESNEFEVSVN